MRSKTQVIINTVETSNLSSHREKSVVGGLNQSE